MTNHTVRLDAEELMHLALHAVETKSPEKALAHLKDLLEQEPENGKAHYLMGAVHAEIQMYDRAAEEMARALELEPDLHTARFQLGLLQLTSGKTTEAETVWSHLDDLGDKDPLFVFKTGLLHLVRDEFQQCADKLASGIELNTFNEDLNNDMRRVLEDAQKMASKQSGTEATPQEEEKPADGRHILLSIYKDEDNDNN